MAGLRRPPQPTGRDQNYRGRDSISQKTIQNLPTRDDAPHVGVPCASATLRVLATPCRRTPATRTRPARRPAKLNDGVSIPQHQRRRGKLTAQGQTRGPTARRGRTGVRSSSEERGGESHEADGGKLVKLLVNIPNTYRARRRTSKGTFFSRGHFSYFSRIFLLLSPWRTPLPSGQRTRSRQRAGRALFISLALPPSLAAGNELGRSGRAVGPDFITR